MFFSNYIAKIHLFSEPANFLKEKMLIVAKKVVFCMFLRFLLVFFIYCNFFNTSVWFLWIVLWWYL